MIHKENIPESSYFTNIVSAVPKRDKIRITLSNESDDLFIFYNNVYDAEKYKEFMDRIEFGVCDVEHKHVCLGQRAGFAHILHRCRIECELERVVCRVLS